jgi:RNA polymerase sigma-70 factor (ECF subfamily)
MRAGSLETTPAGAAQVATRVADRAADAAGDAMARFSAIVEDNKDLLVNYLTRLSGDRDRAEDLAQETFLRFYQLGDRYRDQGTPRAYLLKMATNLLRDEQRRRGRWLGLLPIFSLGGRSPDGIHTEELPREGDPQRLYLSGEAQRAVQAAMGGLDLLFRVPLVLREIEGLAYQEIAEILDCQEGTVKSRLHRARQALKEKLAPFWRSGAAGEEP